jgi:putative addiction module component (TIGR02574 family)
LTILALAAISGDNSMMNEKVKALSQEARKLAPAERAALIDDLMASLDRPDAAIDALWAKEAEDRLAAHDRGEMATHDVAEVVAKLRSR